MEDDGQPMNMSGRKRSRGGEQLKARAKALEQLKAIRSGGRRSDRSGGVGFQIRMEEPIYDTVDEDEYGALVAKRKEEAKGFIVDDDGLGYGDQGEEEDWTKAGADYYSSEEEEEGQGGGGGKGEEGGFLFCGSVGRCGYSDGEAADFVNVYFFGG